MQNLIRFSPANGISVASFQTSPGCSRKKVGMIEEVRIGRWRGGVVLVIVEGIEIKAIVVIKVIIITVVVVVAVLAVIAVSVLIAVIPNNSDKRSGSNRCNAGNSNTSRNNTSSGNSVHER